MERTRDPFAVLSHRGWPPSRRSGRPGAAASGCGPEQGLNTSRRTQICPILHSHPSPPAHLTHPAFRASGIGPRRRLCPPSATLRSWERGRRGHNSTTNPDKGPPTRANAQAQKATARPPQPPPGGRRAGALSDRPSQPSRRKRKQEAQPSQGRERESRAREAAAPGRPDGRDGGRGINP